MADVITKQELIDASEDAHTLEEVVNSDNQTEVTSRLGRVYPSIAKALYSIIQTGGFEPFATEAQLLASVPDMSKKAAKALDTGKIWLWNGSSWIDTGLSELDQAKNYTDSEVVLINENIEKSIKSISYIIYTEPSNDDIFVVCDKDGEIVCKIDKSGAMHIVGIPNDVQSMINSNSKSIMDLSSVISKQDDNNLFYLCDKDGEIVLRIGLDGKAYFVGLDTDLVSYLKSNSGSIKDTSIALIRSYLDTFTSETQALLNSLQYAETGSKAPAPLHLFKHNFKTNKTWINDINQITFANSTRLEIDSPYRKNDGVCHPNIIEFWNGFLGYRYIITITPYFNTNEAEENPCIYGSNDLINFDLLDGFEQPLDPRPTPPYSTGHNSDNVLTYDPRTGELICIWRQTLRNPNNDGVRTDSLWMRKTKDGKSWTQKERIFINTNHPESNAAGSPAILYDVKSGYWYMYLTRLAPSSTDLRLFRAKKLNENSWEYVGIISTPFTPWHQEVKFVGDKVVMLVYCYPPDNTLYFGIADDFQNFTWSENKYGETSCYKSSFVPEINDQNQLALKVLYSTDAQPENLSEKWRMYMHQTNFMNVDLELH